MILLAACGPRPVAVVVIIPDGHGGDAPVSHLEVAAPDIDPDSARALLAAETGLRPIDLRRFDSLRQAFAGPFQAWLAASAALGAARGAGADTSAAAVLAAHARRALDSVSRPVLPELLDESRRIAARDKDMHPGWDSILDAAERPRPGEHLVDTTSATGVAHLVISRASHWIWAEAPDASDPFLAWRWSVPVAGDTVRLTPLNGHRVPRKQ